MQRERPTSVLVIAIFHFIFGGLGLLCGLTAVGGQALGGGRNPFAPPAAGAAATAQQQELQDFQKKIEQRSEQEAPLQKMVAPVIVVIGLLLSVLLIVAGVGLLQLKSFGWWGSVVYGVVSLLTQIFSLFFNLLYALPIAQRILDEELQNHPTLAPMAGFMQIIAPITIGVLLLGMIYPAIVLIVMSRSTVRAAFSGAGAAGVPDDFNDRYAAGGPPPDAGQYSPGSGPEPPPGYGQEPDDRIGPAPR